MELPQKGFPLRHTKMPSRKQITPYGEVKITSRVMRKQYLLVACGSQQALRWMFPKHSDHFENITPTVWRHVFTPVQDQKITVERELRSICALWQDEWTTRLQDHQEGYSTPQTSLAQPIYTLGQLIDTYSALRKGDISASTSEKNKNFLQHWLTVLGKDCPLDSLTEDGLLTARAQIAKTRSPTTVNDSLSVLKQYLNWACKKSYMQHPVFSEIKKMKAPKNHHGKPWWNSDMVDLALRCAGQDKHQPTAQLLIGMGCLLGLRYHEMIMQRWENLDLVAKDANGPAPVCHVVPHSGWVPKDKESRAIPIHERLHALFIRYQKPSGYVLEPENVCSKKGGTKRVYRYDPAAVWNRILKRVVDEGGVKISPHGMRHSFASNLIIAGTSDVLVARWMGHADTSLLHERYGHLQAYHAGINAVKFGEPLA
jgi:integrase